jgi:hypothetical protein
MKMLIYLRCHGNFLQHSDAPFELILVTIVEKIHSFILFHYFIIIGLNLVYLIKQTGNGILNLKSGEMVSLYCTYLFFDAEKS